MNRRRFLRMLGLLALALGAGKVPARADTAPKSGRQNPFRGLRIIDAHAHPDRLHLTKHDPDDSSSVSAMTEMGMAASVFSAVGDRVHLSGGRLPGPERFQTMRQLDFWKDGIVKSGKVKLVLKSADIPPAPKPGDAPGCILAVEGGDPLSGNPDRVNEFYDYGVRLVTLMHYRNNELGDCMKSWKGLNPGPRNGGLTAAGRRVIERMQNLGMVVDVAHADSQTLRQIAEITQRPVLDSHGSPCALADTNRCGRFRTWTDMETIAKTGGVVCTWTWRMTQGRTKRETFRDWAAEIMEMKRRIGMEHVGLGTDGGGGIPRFVSGYRDIRDLSHLVSAMQDEGFSPAEIAAYMGGNTYRVLEACMG